MSRLAAIRGGGRSIRAKISGRRGRPQGIFFGFYKTRHILLSDSANCTVLRAVVLTQYRRVTDGQTDEQTDGIAVASTALAKRQAAKNSMHESCNRLSQAFFQVDLLMALLGTSSQISLMGSALNVLLTPKVPENWDLIKIQLRL